MEKWQVLSFIVLYGLTTMWTVWLYLGLRRRVKQTEDVRAADEALGNRRQERIDKFLGKAAFFDHQLAIADKRSVEALEAADRVKREWVQFASKDKFNALLTHLGLVVEYPPISQTYQPIVRKVRRDQKKGVA